MVHLNQQQEPMDFMRLNFLTEKPTVNWIDFFVHGDKFEEYLAGDRKDPPLHTLILEFVEKGQWEDQEASESEYSFDEQQRHWAKATRLWCLALAGCCQTGWNFEYLIDNTNLYALRTLFDRLLSYGFQHVPEKSYDIATIHQKLIERCANISDWSSVPNSERSVLWLYCRFCIAVNLKNCVPAPPPRVSVYNQQAIADVNVIAASKNRSTLSSLRCLLNECVQLVASFGNDNTQFGDGIRLPNVHAFVAPDQQEMTRAFKPDLDRSTDALSFTSLIVQAHFDLTRYHTADRQYSKAKTHFQILMKSIRGSSLSLGELDKLVDMASVNGYCDLFGIARISSTEKKRAASDHPVTLDRELDEQFVQQLTASVCHGEAGPSVVLVGPCARSFVRRQADTKFSPDQQVHDQLYAWLMLKSMLDRRVITSNLINLFAKEKLTIAFIKTLSRFWPELSTSEQEHLSSCVQFLINMVPGLRPLILSHSKHIAHVLPSAVVGRPPWHADAIKPAFQPSELKFTPFCEQYRVVQPDDYQLRVLYSFDPAEVCAILTASCVAGRPVYGDGAPRAYMAPVVLQDSIVKTGGESMHVLTMLSYKMQQMADLRVYPLWTQFANQFMLSFGAQIDVSAQSALASEAMRVELLTWHDRLFKTSDMAGFGKVTSDLATGVKNYIDTVLRARVHPGQSPAPSDVCVLLSTFLLNTTDMDYMIKCDSFTNRFFDLSRLLAALWDEVRKGGQSTVISASARGCVDGLHRYLLPILDSNAQLPAVRFHAGENRREPNLLMSGTDLTMLLSFVKEHTITQLVLSYLCRVLETTSNGLEHIFSEKSSANQPYVMMLIKLTIDNSLTINPNNAFVLRSLGDSYLVGRRHADAMRAYLECLAVCTNDFCQLPATNIADDQLYANMQSCCLQLSCATEYLLLSQLRATPSPDNKAIYVQSLKAYAQCQQNRDAGDMLYSYIWDMNLAEYLLDHLQTSAMLHKAQILMKVMTSPDMNIHNGAAVHDLMIMSKRRAFFRLLCSSYFT